jgi:hypothetical protein
MRDYIGQSDMTVCANATLVPDRFNNPQSALFLNNGYCTLPPDVYFNGGPFTILAWVNIVQAAIKSRLLDFGNGPNSDNVIFCILSGTSRQPYVSTFQGSSGSSKLLGSAVSLNVWTHLAWVFDAKNSLVYVNGSLSANQTMWAPKNLLRQQVYIGRSNWHFTVYKDSDAQAYFDDIKIYNRALSGQEIMQDMS